MIFDRFRSKSSSKKAMAKSRQKKKITKDKAASSIKAKIEPQVEPNAAESTNQSLTPEISSELPNSAAKYPLFYNNVTVLMAEQHSSLKLKTKRDFKFSKSAHSVPVTIREFSKLSRFYPIVFTAGEQTSCMAILGVPPQKNLFISEAGAWRDNYYIPAYVRSYPFMLAATQDPTKIILCADTKATSLSEDGDELLFEQQKPTKLLEDKLAFSRALYDQFKITNEFTAALSEQNLLVEKSVKLTTAEGQETGASGFRVIDETKFSQLADDVFLDWRKRGWLPAIYLQILSMNNWGSLAAN
jgi:hypothetical protein